MRWWRSRVIVVVGALALAAGAWWGLVRDSGTSADPAPVRLRLDPGEILDRVPGCRRETCRIVDRRDGFTFDGNRVAMVVVDEPGTCHGLSPASVHLVTPSSPLWSSPREAVCGDPIGGIDVDETGHAFLAFPAGDGATKLVVLRVEGDEVKDFRTFGDRFVDRRVEVDDLQGDGIYEIVVGQGGSETVYAWNGDDYVERR